MLTYEQNVKAVLECIFAGYKDELIEDACRRICALSSSEIPNTCGDAISRQAVLDVTWEEPSYTDALNVLTEVREKVRALPSVTPQQRTGRWIKQNYGWNWQCSECGFVTPPSAKEIFTFCPNCGAKMEVEE